MIWLFESSIWQYRWQVELDEVKKDFVDRSAQRKAAEGWRQQASDVLNELIVDDYGPTASEKSFYDRKTETWETQSTTTDNELSDDNCPMSDVRSLNVHSSTSEE